MFTQITMIDYTKPLAQRTRKQVGPYYWQPANRALPNGRNARNTGRGFYQASDSLSMDARGSTMDLRLDYASTHGKRMASYAFTSECDQEFTAIVARLPHQRGFLAGWTMGKGMFANLDGHIWATIEDAACDAANEAERAANEDTRDSGYATKLTAPSAWASYLTNGDASGIDDDERKACDAWLASTEMKRAPDDCVDAGFIRYHDAYNECPLAADCQTYLWA